MSSNQIIFIINTYERFKGNLVSVRSSFQIKYGKDISYKTILKVISNTNNAVMKSYRKLNKVTKVAI